jgi:hypothetical protein
MPGPFTRNSFRPVVIGDIVPAPNGTEVRVRMRLQAAVAAFMTVWFGGLLIGAGALVRQAMTHGFCHDLGGKSGAGVGGALAGVGGMALLGYLLMSAGFWSEVKKVRVLLREQIGNDAAAK